MAGAKEKEARANARAAHDTGDSEMEYKYLADAKNWEEGGDYRAALHAAGGALVAGLGGGNTVAGAVGAGASSLAAPKLQELGNAVSESMDTGNAGLNEALGNVAANIAAGGIGAIVSGGSSEATAANVDRFNRQLHPDEYALAKKNAGLVAKKLGISVDDAQGRIVAELLRNVDGQTAQASGGIHDYQVRSILGCQMLGCGASSSDTNYWNPTYNSPYIAPNQLAYNLGVAQYHTGQTYNRLVTSKITKDPVGATLAGAGMISLGVVTAGGVPMLAGMATGGTIGGVANASMQAAFNGSVNPVDVAFGTITGALTYGTALLPSLLINTGGALAGSTVKGDDPIPSMAGAALGTTIGYGLGMAAESTLNGVFNPWYREQWKSLGLGITVAAPKNPIPSLGGTAMSGFGQEFTGNILNSISNSNAKNNK